MTKEFNLSSYVCELEEGEVIKASRVKEFIKLLKEYVIISKKNLDADIFLIKIIDTLAGKSLTE